MQITWIRKHKQSKYPTARSASFARGLCLFLHITDWQKVRICLFYVILHLSLVYRRTKGILVVLHCSTSISCQYHRRTKWYLSVLHCSTCVLCLHHRMAKRYLPVLQYMCPLSTVLYITDGQKVFVSTQTKKPCLSDSFYIQVAVFYENTYSSYT
jgi:hypothetical protein